MLARANRLTSGPTFAVTIRRGRRASRSTLVLHLDVHQGVYRDGHDGPDAGGPAPRVGLVVGKAVGGAVARNQVKRRLRHIVRERLDRLPGGAVLVVRALPAAGSAPTSVLARDVDAALARLLGHGRP